MSLELDKYIDALFPPQRDMKSKFWHDNTIWAVIQTYPADLRIKCERLRHLFSQFVYEGDFSALTPDEEFNYQFFQKFYYWLSKTEQFETSFTRAGGLKLEYGLEWCKCIIQKYYEKYRKIPVKSIYPFDSMNYHIKKDFFKQFNIKNWQDLLSEALIERYNYIPDQLSIKGEAGLKRAQKYTKFMFETTGQIPRSEDNGVFLIAKAIRRGVWKKYQIATWSDFLWSTLTNSQPPYPNGAQFYLKFDPKQVSAEETFNLAKSQLRQYQQDQNKFPLQGDFPKIANKCRSKTWNQFGIYCWNDLLKEIFGTDQTKTKMNTLAGLNLIRGKLKEIYLIKNRIPKWNDSGIPTIISMINKGYWKEWGIYIWADLKKFVFEKSEAPLSH